MAALILYGSSVADGTLTTAAKMAEYTTGGVETSKFTPLVASGAGYLEIWSLGKVTAPPLNASLPAQTGQGWIDQATTLEGQTIAADTWAINMAYSTDGTANDAFTFVVRVAVRSSGGAYTTIGSLSQANITPLATRTAVTFSGALPSASFAVGDRLYLDTFIFRSDWSTIISSTVVNVFESNSGTAGVANDTQITTPTFAVTSSGFLKRLYMPYAIPRALGGTIIPQVIKPPVIYEPRALGSTLLTDARIFIPRALGGTYIQDDPTLLWVPLALGGTTQVPTSVALTSTIQAIGLESTTLSLATALADTIPAIGALTPTLTASVALSSTLAAIGVLTPSAFTESTAFADTIPAVGTLSGSLLASLDLGTSTIPAVGTLTGTFTESTALSTTIPAVGTLTGTLSTSTNVNLSVTIPAVGTLTMAGAALSTALATTIPAVGVLNPVLTASLSLASLSIPAVGTLVGTLGASAPLSSTVAGVGTLSATMAESTSLTSSLSAVGTLNGTLAVGNSVSFTVTIPAVGTLTASAPGLKTALTVSIAALGTISPGATFSEALTGTTLVAIGTISGSVSLAVILGATIPGAGVISAVYQARTALSLQLMALGALVGTIRVPATFFGPYSATERVSSKLASTHTVTSKTSSHTALSYTAVRK